MKQVKILGTLFFLIAFSSIQPLHAMAMQMAPMPIKSKKKLCTKAKKKRVNPQEERRDLREREDTFIKNLLTSSADLNENTAYGGKPLEIVYRLKSIITLLQHGADPRLCKQSLLIRPLFYYIHRKYKMKGARSSFSWEQNLYYAKRREEQDRRAGKAFACFDLLLKAGANATLELDERLPLLSIAKLYRRGYLPITQDFFKLLIWKGAHPAKKEFRTGKSAYSYVSSYNLSSFNYLRQERQKYEAVCQLLAGHKDENSPLSLLPEEILKEIRVLIRHGVPFDPPPEKKIMPPKIEKSEKTIPTRSRRSIFRRMPVTIIVGVVAIGIGYWAYKKWKKRKKKREKQRQELWDKYYRNRIIY